MHINFQFDMCLCYSVYLQLLLTFYMLRYLTWLISLDFFSNITSFSYFFESQNPDFFHFPTPNFCQPVPSNLCSPMGVDYSAKTRY